MEFGISGFDILMTKLHSKFREAMFNEFSNRFSSINSNMYGNPKPSKPSLKFSVDDVLLAANRIMIECIEEYLPKRAIQTESEVDKVYDESFDKVGTILQRRESDVVINPKPILVNVTKKKVDTVDNPWIKNWELEELIKDEIPKDLAVPKFSSPNPIKSTKKDLVNTITTAPTNNNTLQNANSYAVGGGGGGSDS